MLEQDEIEGQVGCVSGSLIEAAALIGLPPARLRLALPKARPLALVPALALVLILILILILIPTLLLILPRLALPKALLGGGSRAVTGRRGLGLAAMRTAGAEVAEAMQARGPDSDSDSDSDSLCLLLPCPPPPPLIQPGRPLPSPHS